MIKVVYVMLAIAIENLEICLGYSNMPFEKIVIWFESLTPKKKTGKETASALYYKYQKFVL